MATSFFSRWSQRKLDGDKGTEVEETVNGTVDAQSTELPSINDPEPSVTSEQIHADISVESLDDSVENVEGESPSVAQLLVSEASESVKKAALRKLFLSEEFNVRDGLDDYDDDYSNLKSLSEGVADTLRDWVKETVEDSEPVTANAKDESTTTSDTLEQEVAEAEQEDVQQEGFDASENEPQDTLNSDTENVEKSPK
ncbi:DUF3306 domain-containing protein [Vibrio pelagius]|uniref:DUF3306 domain-containing protein n=1 Tax=Vibrio pelagius TaxID=28169 RepID=A0ABY5G4D1_VIBPE|nr:DUF3306 domain-containing protein [Vibrio pelagius]UTT84793.1 DUF3306 domain-containing protein [Vibrio pelagius]